MIHIKWVSRKGRSCLDCGWSQPRFFSVGISALPHARYSEIFLYKMSISLSGWLNSRSVYVISMLPVCIPETIYEDIRLCCSADGSLTTGWQYFSSNQCASYSTISSVSSELLFHYSVEQEIPPRVILLQYYFFSLQILMHYRHKFSCGPWVVTTIYFPPMYSHRRWW